MYGTITRVRVKPGLEGAADELSRRWLRERAPNVAGFIGEYLVKSADRPGEVMSLVIFDSEENYRKNAADPEQDRWYRQFRALMEADPEWFDGEITGVTSEVVAL
jgi:heme-degrading monooxygenase HmoA